MQRFLWLLLVAGLSFNCGGENIAAAEETTDTTEETNTRPEASTEGEEAAASATVLNPNLATQEELAALSGVSPELAQQIIAGRPYLNMNDFHSVVAEAIDAAALEGFFAACFVPLNLNTAPEAEFLLVPGVGEKMAHEFEEYRPYKKVAQFRREMGKYVDDAEIARYENYVFVPIALNTATDEEILGIPGVGDRMLHEFKEYRPYTSLEQFRREIGKYVDDNELARLERFVYLDTE